MPPTTARLAYLRGREDVFMPDACQIFQPAMTRDGKLGERITYPDTPTATVNCRYAPQRLRSREEAVGEVVAARQLWDFVFAYDLAVMISPRDRFVAGGRSFEVIQDQFPRSYATAVTVTAVEVE